MEMDLSSKDAFKALLVFSGLLAVCGSGMGVMVINEVELSPPDNATIWVELYNGGDESVDLTGWTVKIEDEPWTGSIPLEGIIEPKGFYVADGQPRWITSGNGSVYLLDSTGVVVDRTPEQIDNEHNDFTWSRIPDGKDTDTDGDFAYFMGSRGRSNGRGMIA